MQGKGDRGVPGGLGSGIVVRKSSINRRGVFAARGFKKEEVVLRWHPKILTKAQFEKAKVKHKHYLWKSGKDKYFLMQSPERFVNHSCESNTRARNHCDVALRAIKKGEEITSDYGKTGPISFTCRCGSKKCRGVVRYDF